MHCLDWTKHELDYDNQRVQRQGPQLQLCMLCPAVPMLLLHHVQHCCLDPESRLPDGPTPVPFHGLWATSAGGVLAGHYAVAVCDPAAAALHFKAAAESSPSVSQAQLAAAAAALALLATQDLDSLTKAVQLLQDYRVWVGTDCNLPCLERYDRSL